MEDLGKTVKIWTVLVRKIWDDPSLKDQIKSDPHKFFKENGLDIPESQVVQIHENTPTTIHLVIPEKPSKELSDEILSHIVAGIK